jgi:hypothetical protein
MWKEEGLRNREVELQNRSTMSTSTAALLYLHAHTPVLIQCWAGLSDN